MLGTRTTAAALVLLTVLSLGCASSPTTVLTDVGADATVPPILILQLEVARTANPSDMVMSLVQSLGLSDATDRPGPFTFPLAIPLGVDPRFACAVTITVNGIDWDTNAVIATGSAQAQVVPQQQTTAMLTLTAVPPSSGGDGGDGGAADGSSD
jgi:hypothetical protein